MSNYVTFGIIEIELCNNKTLKSYIIILHNNIT